MSDFRMMNRFRISRRQLLGAAATTAVASVVLAREASTLSNASDSAGANDRAGSVDPASAERHQTAAWLDGMLSGDDLERARATFTHATLAHAARSSAQGAQVAPATQAAHAAHAAQVAQVAQVAGNITAPPFQPTILEHDLLWQWRRNLAQELRQGVRAVAITRWDKAILLNGLAREAALPVRQSRISRSLFQTEIG